MTDDDLRLAAARLIRIINEALPKWRAWFPDESSDVGVPREDLLALKHFAEIGLTTHPADDAEKPTLDFAEELLGDGEPTIGFISGTLVFSVEVVRLRTKRAVRLLAELLKEETRHDA